MQKYTAAALVALLFIIGSFGAKSASAEQITLDPAMRMQVGDYTLAFGKAVKAAERKFDVALFSYNACGDCSDLDLRADKLDKATRELKALQASKISIANVNAQVQKIKAGIGIDRNHLDQLRVDVGRLQALQIEDSGHVAEMLTHMANSDVRQAQQQVRIVQNEARTTVIEQKLPIVEAKADAALTGSVGENTELMLGVGKSFTMREVQLGVGSTLLTRGTGSGMQVSLWLGMSDMDNLRVTSGAFRLGFVWPVGGPFSSLIADVSGHLGITSQTDITEKQENQFGGGFGLKYLDAFGPISIGTRIEYTMGMNTRPMASIFLGFNPWKAIASAANNR